MTLNEFIKDNKEFKIGEVKSGMEAEDVEMPEKWWQSIVQSQPHIILWRVDTWDEKQVRFFIELLDTVIQDDFYGASMNAEQIEDAKDVREQIIEEM